MADAHPETSLNECREPTPEDLAMLCGALNQAGARYVVIGGFAMRAAGFVRSTMDVEPREKDAADRLFLRELLEKRGIQLAPGGPAGVKPGRFLRWLEGLFGGKR